MVAMILFFTGIFLPADAHRFFGNLLFDIQSENQQVSFEATIAALQTQVVEAAFTPTPTFTNTPTMTATPTITPTPDITAIINSYEATISALQTQVAEADSMAVYDVIPTVTPTTELNQNTEEMGIWMIKYYVDDFGLPTSEGYVTNSKRIIGTFSNWLTTDSKLEVIWLIDKDDIALKLYEYGNDLVKGSLADHEYSIKILDADKKQYEMKGILYKGSDRIYFYSQYYQTILNVLNKNGSTSFVLKEIDSYSPTSYSFTVTDTSYFSNAYNQLIETSVL